MIDKSQAIINNSSTKLSPTLKRLAEQNSAATARQPGVQRYFPDLYRGDIASDRLLPKYDIKAETKADPERKRLYEASQEFQAIFVKMMLKAMRSTLNRKGDMLYGGQKQEIFEDMLYDEYSSSMSKNSGFGLADAMYRQLSSALPPVGSSTKTAAREYTNNLGHTSPQISTSRLRVNMKR